jgi:transposase
MLSFPTVLKILVSIKPIDMRCGIDSLTVKIVEQLHGDPQGKTLFLFCNRQRNKVKGLYWDKTGFILIYKRLERSKFYIPKLAEINKLEITHEQLQWLLAGLDFMRLTDNPEFAFKHYS